MLYSGAYLFVYLFYRPCCALGQKARLCMCPPLALIPLAMAPLQIHSCLWSEQHRRFLFFQEIQFRYDNLFITIIILIVLQLRGGVYYVADAAVTINVSSSPYVTIENYPGTNEIIKEK